MKTSLLPILAYVLNYRLILAGALGALLVTSAVSLGLGQGVRLIIDEGFVAQSPEQLSQATIMMVAMIAVLAVATCARFYMMSWLGERISADVRKAVFGRLVVLHPSYYEENRSGEIMSRLTTDTTLLQSIIGSSLSMALRSFLMMVGGIVMMFFTSVKLTLVVLVVVPFGLLPIMIFGRKIRRLSRRSQDTVADIGTYAGEVIHHIKVVQSYTRETFEKEAFEQEVETAFDVSKRRITQRSALIGVMIFLVYGAISIMFWGGGQDVLAGKITSGELAAFVFYALLVAMSLATISEVYGELQRAAGAAERLQELLNVTPDIQSPTHPATLKENSGPYIEFDNVTFCYPSRPEQPALRNFSLTIKRGEVVALVGHSGAGKTTLFELMQRFYDPQQGEIKLSGQPIKTLSLKALRDQMGLVTQHPVLFSTDVTGNIAYGRGNLDQSEIEAAAKRAHAEEFISRLEQGYNSHLGEKGVRLSGGQQQRIALARAILKDPDVLLLDEATSALDAESEYHVQAGLNELMKGRTTLIIAHRLATVQHADRIVVIDQGEIVASGTHKELINESEIYSRLCKLQFSQ